MRIGPIACIIAASAVVGPGLASPSAADNPVTIDVVVTDAKARPIKNLQPGDLDLTDSGEGRAVDSVRLQSNEKRVIGIFLDEFHVSPGASTTRARTALMHFIDTRLRDGDTFAIVKPLDPLHAITFVQDLEIVRQAIAAFEGRQGDYTPRTEFERNFLSRDPRTAEVTRAQVVSAALQALAQRLGDQHEGRKALIFVSQGFRPAQPRAIVYAANSNGVAIHPVDPDPGPADHESLLRSMAEQTGGYASINEPDLAPALAQVASDLDHYFEVTFTSSSPDDGRFHPVQVRVKQPGAQARARSGYWTTNAALADAAAKANTPRITLGFRPTRASPYIRPWIGLSRGPGGLTTVTVTWEAGAPAPRNQRVTTILVKATNSDGTVLFENRLGPGDGDRATFDAPPGFIALELELHTSSGQALDTDYRSLSVPNLLVTKPTIATPQVIRTRTARQFSDASQDPEAQPSASRTFSRTERLLVRVPAYADGDTVPSVTARLLNRRGVAMRELPPVAAPLAAGTVQFDLPLASLAPDEYRLELVAANPAGPRDEAREILTFHVTH
jgi:VWFA-related protein